MKRCPLHLCLEPASKPPGRRGQSPFFSEDSAKWGQSPAVLKLVLAIAAAASIALAVSRVAAAADPQPAAKPAQSLDEQLLQGLDNSLDGKLLGGDKPAAARGKSEGDGKATDKNPADAKPSAKKKSPLVDPLDEELENSLSAGEDIGSPGENSKNPLARIVVQMRQVQQRLAESKSDGLTQREQKRISDELKSFIEQLALQEQQQQSQADPSASQPSSRGNPKQGNAPAGKTPPGDPNKEPSKNSSPSVRKDHTDRPDPALAREAVAKELDRLHLPAKNREEMLQSPPDEFLPGHEESIEQYFKRLVEQEQAGP